MAGWPSGQNSVSWLVLLTVGSVLSKKPAFSGLFFALDLYAQVISSASCSIRYDPLDSSVPMTDLCGRVTMTKLSIIELPVSLLWLTNQFVLCLESMGGNLPCSFLWRDQLLIICFGAKKVSRQGRKRVGLWSNTETPFFSAFICCTCLMLNADVIVGSCLINARWSHCYHRRNYVGRSQPSKRALRSRMRGR